MNHLPLLDALIDDDDYGLNIELGTFAKSIIKRKSLMSFTFSFLS
jgi:hypothetical protein